MIGRACLVRLVKSSSTTSWTCRGVMNPRVGRSRRQRAKYGRLYLRRAAGRLGRLGEVERVAVRILDVRDPLAPRHVVRRCLHPSAEGLHALEENIDRLDLGAEQDAPRGASLSFLVGDDAELVSVAPSSAV